MTDSFCNNGLIPGSGHDGPVSGSWRVFALIGSLCVACPESMPEASAQDFVYISSDGDEYTYVANENGAVLTSVYPKHYWVGQGAATTTVKGLDVFYFGKDCDATHKYHGTGTWGWANGGFGADFDDFSLRFPRQETLWNDDLGCRW